MISCHKEQAGSEDDLLGVGSVFSSCGSWRWSPFSALAVSTFAHWAISAAQFYFIFSQHTQQQMALWRFYIYVLLGGAFPVSSPPPHLPAFHSLLSSHSSVLPSIFHVTHPLLSPPCRSPKTSSLLHTALSSFQVSIHLLPHTGRLEARILRWESTCGVCFADLELPHSIARFPENSMISVFFYTIPLCVSTP